MHALTSTRISIRFPPADAYEDAAVTVLTTRRGFYVDVRVCNASSGRDGELQSVAAGRKELLPGGRARWTQYLSSAPPLPDNAEESTSAPHPDDPTLILETGRMHNPATGEEADFEEVWHDVAAPPEAVVRALEREDGAGWVVVVGERCVGVVREGWAAAEARWEGKGWVVVRSTGEAGGLVGVAPGPEEVVQEGDVRVVGEGRWVVREA